MVKRKEENEKDEYLKEIFQEIERQKSMYEWCLKRAIQKESFKMGYTAFIGLFFLTFLYVIYVNISVLTNYSLFFMIALIPTVTILNEIAVLMSMVFEPLITKFLLKMMSGNKKCLQERQ